MVVPELLWRRRLHGGCLDLGMPSAHATMATRKKTHILDDTFLGADYLAALENMLGKVNNGNWVLLLDLLNYSRNPCAHDGVVDVSIAWAMRKAFPTQRQRKWKQVKSVCDKDDQRRLIADLEFRPHAKIMFLC